MSFGTNLRAAREAKGLSQGQLSDMLDIKRQTVTSWEADVAFPKVDKLLLLSVTLDVSLDTLLADELAYYRKETAAAKSDPEWEAYGARFAEALKPLIAALEVTKKQMLGKKEVQDESEQ